MRHILFLIIGCTLLSCSGTDTVEGAYSIEKHFTKNEQDTLLADIITYIYKKPKYADHSTKFEPQYRGHYVSQLPNFEMVYYYQEPSTGYHYYYLIRPARSLQGNTRGVGGRYKVNNKNQVIEFEEIFNTPVQEVGSLKKTGLVLFEEMIKTGTADAYVGKPDYIEWPDDRLKYDRERHEWRYDAN